MSKRKQKPSRWQRLQKIVNNPATRRLGRGAKNVYATYRGSSRWRYRFLTAVLGVLLLVGLAFAWSAGWFASEPERIVEGRSVTRVEPPGSLTPQRETPYAYYDSAGVLQMDAIPAAPETISATITYEGGLPIAVEVHNKWFPEWRTAGANVDASVHCPERASQARCDSVQVTLTPAQRSFTDLRAAPSAGLGVGVGESVLGPSRAWLGADVLRVGPLHAGGGMTIGQDSLGVLDAAPSVSIGTYVKRDVMLYCEDDPRAVLGGGASSGPTCGARLSF